MNIILSIFFSVSFTFIGFFGFSQSSQYRQGVVYVKVDDSVLESFRGSEKFIEAILLRHGIDSYHPLLRTKVDLKSSARAHQVHKVFELTFNESWEVPKVIAGLYRTGLFEVVEPAYVFDLMLGYQPNDPFADSTLQLGVGMNQLLLHDFYSAFAIETGDTNLTIGVVDSGVNFNQEDSKDNLKINARDPIDGLNNDQDFYNGDSLTDNFRGWDVADKDNDPSLDGSSRHGAEMISIIASTPDNETGMVGTGFNCKYMPIKAAQRTNPDGISHGYDGMLLAAQQGCKVINCSWGNTQKLPQIFQDLTEYITHDLDAVVVSAAGNENNQNVYYPASFPSVISVSGLEVDSSKNNVSNWNYHVNLAASGRMLMARGDQTSSYYFNKGTSASAAVVSGLAGLVRSHFPDFTAWQTIKQLEVTADYMDDLPALKPYVGQLGKRINPLKALTDTVSPGLKAYEVVVNSGIQEFSREGERVLFDVSVVNLLRPSKNIHYKVSAMSSNFTVLDSLGIIRDLATADTLASLGGLLELSLHASANELERYVMRVEFWDASGYRDHSYLFFEMRPSQVTGLTPVASSPTLEVFPTVFDQHLFIKSQADIETVELFSMDWNPIGIEVQKNSLISIVPKQELPNGVYYLRVSDRSGPRVIKLIKID